MTTEPVPALPVAVPTPRPPRRKSYGLIYWLKCMEFHWRRRRVKRARQWSAWTRAREIVNSKLEGTECVCTRCGIRFIFPSYVSTVTCRCGAIWTYTAGYGNTARRPPPPPPPPVPGTPITR